MLFFIESPLCINSKYEFFIASLERTTAHNAAVLPVIPLTASYTKDTAILDKIGSNVSVTTTPVAGVAAVFPVFWIRNV